MGAPVVSMRTISFVIAVVAGLWALPAPASAQEFRLGGITVVAPWARATPGGAQVAGAYLEIRAEAGVEDRLIGAKSPAAGAIELHDHIHEGGVMKMRSVEAIAIKGAQTVTLKPGGLHVMLLDLKGPLKQGETVAITLTFEKAGELRIEAPILAIGAMGGSGSGGRSGAGSETGSGSGSGK